MKNRIGIVGGGQLGRMMAFDAKKLGFTVTVIDPTPNSPTGQVVDRQIVADFYDKKAIRELGKISDFLTSEIEFSDSKILDELSQKGVQIHPSAKTFGTINDKLEQKKFLRKAGLPVADFIEVETKDDIQNAAKNFGYPLLLKARFDAYDGRGNALIKNKSQIDIGLNKLRRKKLYVEKFVSFTKELAAVVARSTKGEIVSYPVVETIHKNNICHIVIAPAPVDKKVTNKAKRLAIKTMQHLKGAGVFGIEMFLTKNGKVLINEIAPRVHNSGHFTIEGCRTSQFEQHIRAVTGLPLGSIEMTAPSAVMINILGERQSPAQVKGLEKILKMPNVFVHIYGKAETKNERKMGHITVLGKTVKEAYNKAIKARKLLMI
jgi:5-(carboxyamino)imidazole ribonucleotide synthase